MKRFLSSREPSRHLELTSAREALDLVVQAEGQGATQIDILEKS